MNHIKKILKNIWADESGQGATEYILMLVVIVAIVFALKDPIMKAISGKAESVGEEIQGFSGN